LPYEVAGVFYFTTVVISSLSRISAGYPVFKVSRISGELSIRCIRCGHLFVLRPKFLPVDNTGRYYIFVLDPFQAQSVNSSKKDAGNLFLKCQRNSGLRYFNFVYMDLILFFHFISLFLFFLFQLNDDAKNVIKVSNLRIFILFFNFSYALF
jgi:hypothetical protein